MGAGRAPVQHALVPLFCGVTMSFRQQLEKRIPPALRSRVLGPMAHAVGSRLVDAGIWILGERDPLTPPRRIQKGGTGAFHVGYEFFSYFVEFGELKPRDAVLDIGCGVGRMAVPLTRYLRDGRYEGIDIKEEGIRWCQSHISTAFPNFNFKVADIYNTTYNPRGQFQASAYRFPYSDETFDFIFLTSVFTHLLPEDAANYLNEIGRMLKPGGRLFGTWFLLDDYARAAASRGDAAMPINLPWKDRDDVWVMNRKNPEDAIAFDVELVRQMHAEAGLEFAEEPRLGAWSGRTPHLSFQDILLAKKPRA